MSRCIDCQKHKLIRARGRCSTCYGRYWMSPEFVPTVMQSQRQHRLSNVDATERMADCNRCGRVRVSPIPDYRKRVSYRCNVARAQQKRNRRARNRTLRTVTT